MHRFHIFIAFYFILSFAVLASCQRKDKSKTKHKNQEWAKQWGCGKNKFSRKVFKVDIPTTGNYQIIFKSEKNGWITLHNSLTSLWNDFENGIFKQKLKANQQLVHNFTVQVSSPPANHYLALTHCDTRPIKTKYPIQIRSLNGSYDKSLTDNDVEENAVLAEISYNLPDLCDDSSWYRNQTADFPGQTNGVKYISIFVTHNDTMYVTNPGQDIVSLWFAGDTTIRKQVKMNDCSAHGLFVTNEGDIYVGSDDDSKGPQKCDANKRDCQPYSKRPGGKCRRVFVDVNDYLYCSMDESHKVMKISLEDQFDSWTIAAGGNQAGSTSNLLNKPHGIFVDMDSNLYVADYENDRIQMFEWNINNGTTVAGGIDNISLVLVRPVLVALDSDDRIFIVHSGSCCIVRVGGFQAFKCVFSCSESSPNKLNAPIDFAFDSHGNILIISNEQIHQLKLASNSCNTSMTTHDTSSLLTTPNMTNYVTTTTTSSSQPLSSNWHAQPKFCSFPSWNPMGNPFANQWTSGRELNGMFIDGNNDIYVAAMAMNEIQITRHSNAKENISIPGPLSIFVTPKKDIYIGTNEQKILIWRSNRLINDSFVSPEKSCWDLFVDHNGSVYCSIKDAHKVIKYLDDGSVSKTFTLIAGNGTAGSTPDMLNTPHGIFVNHRFQLFVADCGSNRIQRFDLHSRIGVTVAGQGADNSISLICPMDVILDADGYLFIVDHGNHRVVGSGRHGFRCLLGCTGEAGTASHQFNLPRSLTFDRHGNLYVSESNNSRIQKFTLATNSCHLPYHQPKFCSISQWKPTGKTVGNGSMVIFLPFSVYVDIHDTIYIADRTRPESKIWIESKTLGSRKLVGNLKIPSSLFVTVDGDVYVDNGYNDKRVDVWKSEINRTNPLMHVNNSCLGLFIDINGFLYCSMRDVHQVIKTYPNSSFPVIVVAGTGKNESSACGLSQPRGIFVAINLSIYVADSGNHRIQLFDLNIRTGITIVDKNILTFPTGVIFDGDQTLYIVDSLKHRIIRWTSIKHECLIGCNSQSGSASNQLNTPRTMAFDSQGNIYVTDMLNNRIQFYELATNTCQTSTPPSFFIPSENEFALNMSRSACSVGDLCKNDGTCSDDPNMPRGYKCECPEGFYGTECQHSSSPCQLDTCLNGGSCKNFAEGKFQCFCAEHWEGHRCERKIDYCAGKICLNKGRCRPLVGRAICECIGDSYSGEHCEIVATKMIVSQMISKSFAYIAIIAMCCVAAFVVIMDILKYCFGIDPVEEDREYLRQLKEQKRRRRQQKIEHFVYVNRTVD